MESPLISFVERAVRIDELVQPGKVLVIYGPRQVGKTTLVKKYLGTLPQKVRYHFVVGDHIQVQRILSSRDVRVLSDFLEGIDLLVIDEAQLIPDIGANLKLIVDTMPEKSLIVTGSASFELAGQVGEPLVGRKRTVHLFPFWQGELLPLYANAYALQQDLAHYLIFGSYPEVVLAKRKAEKRELLHELIEGYLLKDILIFEGIRKSSFLFDLLKLLAFQVGSEVSLSELGSALNVDNKTVARYLDLLEKSFVVYALGGFSRNLRKEVTKKRKYYFYDNGILNGIIHNFNALEERNDVGKLWENFLMSERLKKRYYKKIYANTYFWRTYDKKEIDLVEEREGKLFGYEFKWNPKRKIVPPKDWVAAYPEAEFMVVTRENYLEFVL